MPSLKEMRRRYTHDNRYKIFTRAKQVGSCWIYPMPSYKDCPQIQIDGVIYNAKRLAYELAGNVPPKLKHRINQTCGNKMCINPAHLVCPSVPALSRRRHPDGLPHTRGTHCWACGEGLSEATAIVFCNKNYCQECHMELRWGQLQPLRENKKPQWHNIRGKRIIT